MRIAQSSSFLPYPSVVLGQETLSQFPLVDEALRGSPNNKACCCISATSNRLEARAQGFSHNKCSLCCGPLLLGPDFAKLALSKAKATHARHDAQDIVVDGEYLHLVRLAASDSVVCQRELQNRVVDTRHVARRLFHTFSICVSRTVS